MTEEEAWALDDEVTRNPPDVAGNPGMKTVQEYMNDPRLLNDPDMAGALDLIREIHAIRLKLQDETAGMTPEEVANFYNKKAEAFLAPLGKALCYDLVGQGKLKPRQPLT